MRIQDFKRYLNEEKISNAVFLNISYTTIDPSIKYFTGFNSEHALLIIPQTKRETFLLPRMEITRAKKSKQSKVKNIKTLDKDFYKIIQENQKGKNFKIGVNKKKIPEYHFNKLKREINNGKFVDVSKKVLELRKNKTEEEIYRIKKACTETDKILDETYRLISRKKHMTEAVLAARIQYIINEKGYECSFPPLIASGKNASQPHHTPNKTKIRKGFCFIDFGLWYKGYTSDLTRTVYFGNPRKKDKEIYNNLLEAQQNSITATKPGIMARQIDWTARFHLGKMSKYFLHGCGHGIGVEVHERPYLNEKSIEVIQKGQVFTIEPGIYIKNKLGIRIEDDILVGKKAQVLTKSPKELIKFNI